MKFQNAKSNGPADCGAAKRSGKDETYMHAIIYPFIYLVISHPFDVDWHLTLPVCLQARSWWWWWQWFMKTKSNDFHSLLNTFEAGSFIFFWLNEKEKQLTENFYWKLHRWYTKENFFATLYKYLSKSSFVQVHIYISIVCITNIKSDFDKENLTYIGMWYELNGESAVHCWQWKLKITYKQAQNYIHSVRLLLHSFWLYLSRSTWNGLCSEMQYMITNNKMRNIL